MKPGLDPSDESVPAWMNRYPPADIKPAEFEIFLAEIFGSVMEIVECLDVRTQDRIEGVDGRYVFDVTVRFRFAGADYLTVIEAKMHKNPIKRQLVQTLHSKAQSVGAHKGILVSTARYQSGALEFAKTHGIALVTLTEGRFVYETKAASSAPVLPREVARERFGLPTFVGHAYGPGESPGSTRCTLISAENPEYVRDLLLPESVSTESD
jgi:hypothetical protein